jgi:chromosome segregation ATPase
LERQEKVVELNESLTNLEAKLAKAIEVFNEVQAEKRDLEHALEKTKTGWNDYEERIESLQREVQALRREREDVRARLEKLLAQINLLTKADPAG